MYYNQGQTQYYPRLDQQQQKAQDQHNQNDDINQAEDENQEQVQYDYSYNEEILEGTMPEDSQANIVDNHQQSEYLQASAALYNSQANVYEDQQQNHQNYQKQEDLMYSYPPQPEPPLKRSNSFSQFEQQNTQFINDEADDQQTVNDLKQSYQEALGQKHIIRVKVSNSYRQGSHRVYELHTTTAVKQQAKMNLSNSQMAPANLSQSLINQQNMPKQQFYFTDYDVVLVKRTYEDFSQVHQELIECFMDRFVPPLPQENFFDFLQKEDSDAILERRRHLQEFCSKLIQDDEHKYTIRQSETLVKFLTLNDKQYKDYKKVIRQNLECRFDCYKVGHGIQADSFANYQQIRNEGNGQSISIIQRSQVNNDSPAVLINSQENQDDLVTRMIKPIVNYVKDKCFDQNAFAISLVGASLQMRYRNEVIDGVDIIHNFLVNLMKQIVQKFDIMAKQGETIHKCHLIMNDMQKECLNNCNLTASLQIVSDNNKYDIIESEFQVIQDVSEVQSQSQKTLKEFGNKYNILAQKGIQNYAKKLSNLLNMTYSIKMSIKARERQILLIRYLRNLIPQNKKLEQIQQFEQKKLIQSTTGQLESMEKFNHIVQTEVLLGVTQMAQEFKSQFGCYQPIQKQYQ